MPAARAFLDPLAVDVQAGGPSADMSGVADADLIGSYALRDALAMRTAPGGGEAGPAPRAARVDAQPGQLMAAAGVPPHIRAAWCGHTEAVNERTYTAARPEELAVAGTALGKIIKPV